MIGCYEKLIANIPLSPESINDYFRSTAVTDGHQPATTFHPLNFEAFVLLINQLPFKDPG